VEKIRPSFRRLMSEYLRRVFSNRLMVKKIHGRAVTAMELFEFIRAYAKLFKEAKIFPEAQTLLAATAEANNRAALDRAVQSYKLEMDKLAGPGRIYCAENKLKEHHLVCRGAAGDQFKTIASIGPRVRLAYIYISYIALSDEWMLRMMCCSCPVDILWKKVVCFLTTTS
jgi:hypothetical protein